MKHAFTLIELLVVIGILALLVGMIYPAYLRIHERGHAVACISNLRQLGMGVTLYLGDHNGTLPTLQAGRSSVTQDVSVIDNTLNVYITNPNVFICPSDMQGIGKNTGTSYYWNSALNGQSVGNLNFFNITDFTRIPVLSDKEGFHPYTQNKVNMLYMDGHATQDLRFYTGP